MSDEHRPSLSQVPGVIVDQMKDRPLMLLVLMTNFLMIAGLLWFGTNVGESRAEIIGKLIERCMPASGHVDIFEPPAVNPPPLNVKKED